ncbi:MAG: DUF503 domain-containing protein [Candidatus Dadabacteria bacterium]|nr:MAG: DUF503 domain-containing protein [Candidatus Dadabacteria bacterium]
MVSHYTVHLALLTAEFYFEGVSSIKERRRKLNSIKERLKNKFNISVVEVGDSDKWQRAALVISMVSSDKSYLNSSIDKIIQWCRSLPDAYVTDYSLEFF